MIHKKYTNSQGASGARARTRNETSRHETLLAGNKKATNRPKSRERACSHTYVASFCTSERARNAHQGVCTYIYT